MIGIDGILGTPFESDVFPDEIVALNSCACRQLHGDGDGGPVALSPRVELTPAPGESPQERIR